MSNLSPSDEALLQLVTSPAELRRLSRESLPRLAEQIRRTLISTIARAGGHLAASLGTVELSIALHRCLNTPHDRLIWDIGHQAHTHKILSGRLGGLETQRQLGGLAPFLSLRESEYDAFGAGHAGTSISAAAGLALAARLRGEQRRVVAVIGDGGISAGMAFEALNHIGGAGLDVLVVLNDNGMSISENVGALTQGGAEGSAYAGFFRALGFDAQGPVDGHDLDALCAALEAVRDHPGPRLLHVRTIKGRGHAPAEADPIAWHGVPAFDPTQGLPKTATSAKPSYSQVFGDWLCSAAAADPRVVAITPAMREGSGLVEFAARFPDRYIDVGIAEQHAVTLAAGLAVAGLRPVVAIYSTFLQRGLDQLIHDVAVQHLPVLFAVDRAGLVGQDGATHHGAFDLALLRAIPGLVIMTPSDAAECRRMLSFGLAQQGPSAVRYPRGGARLAGGAADPPLSLGEGLLRRHGRRVALLVFGAPLAAALEAAERLDATVADMRFAKPLDQALILQLAAGHDLLVTIEEGAISGGAGSGVNELLLANGIRVSCLNLGLPDRFFEHGQRDELLAQAGLSVEGIVEAVTRGLVQAAPP